MKFFSKASIYFACLCGLALLLAGCGEEEKARKLIDDYWGGMIRLGADTFWEVFDPSGTAPVVLYGDIYLVSACHAWSCTPCFFLRRWHDADSESASFPASIPSEFSKDA